MARPIGLTLRLPLLSNSNIIDVIQSLPIHEWLLHVKTIPILDTRSEVEYAHAHVPNAVSFPLLTNEERTIVGTLYKQQGNEAAVVKGYELVGPKFHQFVLHAKKIAPNKEVGLYCWRGGLRSNIMAFVLHTAGFKVYLLKGGYKQYRGWAAQQFTIPKHLRVIGGKTGSGKTQILELLSAKGHQVLPLEQIANHRGSAFGSLGMPAQPSVEQFENELALLWSQFETNKPVFVENESRTIGHVVIPEQLFNQMRQAPTLAIELPIELRVHHIVKLYEPFGKERLKEATHKLAKRLGNLRLRQAIQLLEENNYTEWATLLLEYYDKTYEYGNSIRKEGTVKQLYFETWNSAQIVHTILESV